MTTGISVLIPASNEAAWIGPCLRALAESPLPDACMAEVIVIANGCTDDTAARARAETDRLARQGFMLRVFELAQGGKTGALNHGETAARHPMRVYLDADVRISPPLLGQLVAALACETARYASGTPQIAPARSRVTRAYARFWQQLPFNRTTAPGFGLFAVNSAGRSRWGAFPQIISDDTYVRLLFAPDERVQVPASYEWPMVEGLSRLIRVRRRQDRGVAEIARRFPELLANEAKPPLRLLPLIRSDPAGFAAYALVALAVRLGRGDPTAWTRGR